MHTIARRRHWLFGLCVAVLLVIAGCAGGAPQPPAPSATTPAAAVPDTLASIHRAGNLRVCSTGDYRPFTYLDPATGRWSGIDVDLARNLAQRLGVRLDLVHTTWGTVLADLTGGRCDAAMGGISVTADRAAKANFSDPYLVDGKAPITRCADASRFQMLTDASETRYQATQHPGQLCAVNPDRPFTSSPKAYLLSHGDTAFQQYVNQWLKAALTDGTYQRLNKPWTG